MSPAAGAGARVVGRGAGQPRGQHDGEQEAHSQPARTGGDGSGGEGLVFEELASIEPVPGMISLSVCARTTGAASEAW